MSGIKVKVFGAKGGIQAPKTRTFKSQKNVQNIFKEAKKKKKEQKK